MKKKVFTKACYMVCIDSDHAKSLIKELTKIGDRSLLHMRDDIVYPCICGVSSNLILIGNVNLDSAGFIDCKDDEKRFLKLASLKKNSKPINKIGKFKYWLRIQGFRLNQFGTGEKSNPIKLNKFKIIKR